MVSQGSNSSTVRTNESNIPFGVPCELNAITSLLLYLNVALICVPFSVTVR